MTPWRSLALLLLVFAIGLAGFAAYAYEPEIEAVDVPLPSAFDAALVRRGATLASLGNCTSCHSAPGGEVLAGGLPMPTPFGTIHSTNITPDPETGIGRWSEAAFIRSMRQGVDREGRHLYPAFPYDHFTTLSDADNRALYAYLMTRRPVRAEALPNDLPFPLNIRMTLAGWKLLFFRPGAFRPDPARDEAWNRGAYLAEGLGHCGACHTPRNFLGAEEKDRLYAGGEAEGWTAYAMNEASPAPIPWTVDSLTHYLRHGWEERHGVARGPMASVAANLGAVPEEDVRAIASFVVSVMGEPSPEKRARAEALLAAEAAHAPGAVAPAAMSQTAPPPTESAARGEAIYAAACSTCHDGGRPLPYGGLRLDHSTAVYGPTPANPINVILNGLPAPQGDRGPIMPGFAASLDDAQIADLLAYLRARFSDRPAWEDPAKRIAELRAAGVSAGVEALDSGSAAPANPNQRETAW